MKRSSLSGLNARRMAARLIGGRFYLVYLAGAMRYGVLRTAVGPRFARFEGDTAHKLDAAPWLGGKETGVNLPIDETALMCPVAPTKIVCIGRNYAAHAKELGNEVPSEPLLFLKPPSALLDPGGTVRLPPESSRVEHEAELAVIIGTRAKNVAKDDALAHVFGYACACDVTARDLQRKDVQFTRAKGFDTFCPVGPFVSDEVRPEAGLTLETRVNGEVRQHGSTSDFIFPIAALLSYITAAITLEPGDLVLTGTPAGVGPLKAGDLVEVAIDALGVLRNTFMPEEA
jgi:2-keto-4-pentenoate hydratase/2-oxohepta-3-ene-1,7-dioic acid hydratase in catechol pathway